MRRCLIHALPAVALLTSVPALAQDQDCPQGAWFCEQVPEEDLPEADAVPPEEEPEAAPPPQRREHHERRERRGPRPRAARPAAPPPVVVYQPPSDGQTPQVVIVTPGGQPPPQVVVRTVPGVPPAPPPPPPRRKWRSEWGFNLRLQGASFGSTRGAAEDAAMGGAGLSLRYRPVPAFAIDLGVDVLGGIDYHGFKRAEIPISLSGMVFVNPRSRVQFYFMGGMHASYAQVERTAIITSDTPGVPSTVSTFTQEYDYFGGHGGIGLEFRVSRHVALNIDGLGFIRSRTDDQAASNPEFYDPATGRTTNTSGGGLFRGGISFYW
ncbi:hypothetical protein [Chondromyces crocatus]|uniref:Outer membrane protein beta-barrel domain-containing protein n=1 Tax=Chondromyces crocatus TaxID=52 RepID=A0A0K1E4W8_CHOCO|nr:hypothetical protein [Chondromyces crocatus]AKT35925.1 uncharacterized protein CMC5_000360 [Chondromyces crocatus]